MFSDERNARIDLYETLDLDGLLALEADNPDDVDLLVRIGMRYFKSHDFENCSDYYVRALKLDPYDGWSHLYFGNMLSAFGCNDDALTHFNYAADFLPDAACPQWCLGDQFLKHDDSDNAGLHYKRAVEIDPDDAMARKKLDEWQANNPG